MMSTIGYHLYEVTAVLIVVPRLILQVMGAGLYLAFFGAGCSLVGCLYDGSWLLIAALAPFYFLGHPIALLIGLAPLYLTILIALRLLLS